jgi:arylsulfatase A-like enzyme
MKWDFTQPIHSGPTARGFDEYFGVDLPNFPPFTFIENERVTELPTTRYMYEADPNLAMPELFDGSPMAPGWRFDNVLPQITRRAIDYINRHAKEDKPFFLYFALTSPHTPVAPSKNFAGKSGIAPIADFVMETDGSVGQILQALDDAKITNETIVIFTADNGHAGNAGWQELIDAGHKPSGPYRGRKGDIWEGGHRVPFIIRWPGRVEAGSSSAQLLCLNDIFATCAHLLGVVLPDEAAEDSFSFLPAAIAKVIRGGKFASRTSLVSHSVHGEFAFREGDWKLIFRMAGPNGEASRGKPTVAELYDLKDDIAEQNNVAQERASLVELLRQKLQKVIDMGASRASLARLNDRSVRFDVLPTERWAPALNQSN